MADIWEYLDYSTGFLRTIDTSGIRPKLSFLRVTPRMVAYNPRTKEVIY